MGPRVIHMRAPRGFVLPRLADVAEGLEAVSRSVGEVDAVHYDTPDRRLASGGILLSHSIGAGLDWAVAFPNGAAVDLPGAPGEVPREALTLLRARLRGEEPVRVGRAITRRGGVDLHDGEGRRVAGVDDDEVSVEAEGADREQRLRLVRIRLMPDAGDGLADRLVAAMEAAGAEAASGWSQILAGALGGNGDGAVSGRLGKGATGADAVRAAIDEAVARIVEHDPGARLGDPHAVHQARVGARRLRSHLRAFRPLVDDAWRVSLSDELKWLGEALGRVRDADVLHDRLVRQVRDLPEVDARAARALLARLERQRDEARTRLADALASERHEVLLDRLAGASETVPVTEEAEGRAADVLPRLARRQWRKLRSAVDDLPERPDDEALHRVRIRAKRARYAAEAAAFAVGRPAARFAEAVAGVQGVLGDHQDAVVADGWLRANSRQSALVAGQLVATQRAEAAAARAEWPNAWRKAKRERLRSWMP